MNKEWLCKIDIHDWKYVKVPYKKIFLQEEITKYEDKFRICQRCGEIERVTPFFHISLDDENEKKILLEKIVDKGDFYLLEDVGEDVEVRLPKDAKQSQINVRSVLILRIHTSKNGKVYQFSKTYNEFIYLQKGMLVFITKIPFEVKSCFVKIFPQLIEYCYFLNYFCSDIDDKKIDEFINLGWERMGEKE